MEFHNETVIDKFIENMSGAVLKALVAILLLYPE